MQTMANSLLVCDMDGTLLQADQGISEQNLTAIKYFVEQGGLFTVATGRTERSVEHYLDRLPINVPAILYNGAVIFDFPTGTYLMDCRLPDETHRVVSQIIEMFPGIGVEVYHEGVIYYPFENSITTMHRYREGFNPDFTDFDLLPPLWHKVVLAIDPGIIETVHTYLRGIAQGFDIVQSEPHFLELLPAGANKGSALRTLTAMIDIDLSHTIAIGDNLNDLEMIREAGYGFAVENAHPELTRNADFSCAHHNDHAVADLIRKVELIMERER